ncbi:hypothetical protein BscR1v2_002170 [Bartonella schoenbuchensis R1]|uniref:Right handed beta helix region n=1 Tax=Bartonella schoenbuchensis (strain DSM 13525 / NCTC 13165 / R1) TaxID=687861 RepID=A0A1S6XNI7_BARSR|nr:hypothetical protein BscR1v2_002170 [Bartonella schoenbuchensis R1]
MDISRFATGVYAKKGVLKMTGGSVKGFTEYGVMVGEGVESASLMGTTITGDGKGTGVMMMGGDVMLNMVNILKVKTGVRVEKGMLKILEGSVTEFTGTGVMVGSEVKSASLMGTTITGDGKGTGVMMMGGDVMLNMVNISRVKTGVYAEKGTLIMNQGSVTDFASYGVMVGDGVKSASLMGVEITGKDSGDSYGVYAMGGDVTLNMVMISQVEMGVYARKGVLKMEGGSVTEFTKTGVIPVMCHTDLN